MIKSNRAKVGLLAASSIALGVLAQAEVHKFSSRDGTKHFYGELVQYLPDRKVVEVRRQSGKRLKFRLDALSEEDQKYVLAEAPLLDLGDDLKITSKMEMGKKTVTKAPPYKHTTTPRSYRITLRNSSALEMKDLTVDYEIHWVKDNGTGRRGEEKKVEKGTASVSSIPAYKELSVTTDAVDVLYKTPYGST